MFGVGSRAYGETFNAVAKNLATKFRALGAVDMVESGEGDVDSGELDSVFEDWSVRVVSALKGELVMEKMNWIGESDVESVESSEEEDGGEDEIVDLEDIAGKGPSRKSINNVESNGKVGGKKEMVTPVIRASLEKQVPCFLFVLLDFRFILMKLN